MSTTRGTVVEWLECLNSVPKVAGLNPTRADTSKTLNVYRAVNGYLTIVGAGLRRQKERIGHGLSYEPRREKTSFLHMRKQRCRSASR